MQRNPIHRHPPIQRREFLRHTALAAAALAAGSARARETTNEPAAEEAKSSITNLLEHSNQIRFALHEPDGKSLSPEHATTLLARDLQNDSLAQPINAAPGRARIGLAKEPIQFEALLRVPGFGEVYCYADNAGQGYTKPANLEFVVEAARTRLHRVTESAELARRAGVPNDPQFEEHLAAAAKPLPKGSGHEQIAAAYESLSHGLHAGERLALNTARHRISRLAKPRTNFLFGSRTSGWEQAGECEQLYLKAFNFAAINWYAWNQEPEPVDKRIDYARQDCSLDWCQKNKVIPKGYGYVYMHNAATPAWIRSWPYEKVLAEYQRVVTQTLTRYRDRMPYVEVINEAHDKANLFHLSHEQLTEVTREACRAARAGSPTVKCIINNCSLWAEFPRRLGRNEERIWAPYRYLSDCVSAGVEFEVVGLQIYYPQHDMFEIERMLQRFTSFNRPIHLTELSCSSAPGLDPACSRPRSVSPGWHGPWTETVQADWLEGMYTLCYSKPEFEAATWWDFTDNGSQFWPHGGLLHKDLTPKESYLRLIELKKRWALTT